MVIEACDFMAKNGSRLAVSDAGAGVVIAKAALQAASLNVVINIGSMDDVDRADDYSARMQDMLDAGCALADDVYASVLDALAH